MNRIPFVTEGVLDIASDINSSLAAADGLITSRISGFLTEPPVNALDDSRYGVSAGASGKWFGKDGQLALYVAEGDFWKFYSPLHVFYLDTLYVSNGFSWTPVEGRLENKGKVVQTKGQSIYDVMSQKSVTDEINTKADTSYTDTELFKKVDKVAGQSLFKDTERTKLSGIATEATKNRSDAEMDVIWDTKVDKVVGKELSDTNFTQVEKTKLSGVAVGATKNATDAQLRDRTSHTGEQPISTVTSLQSTLDSKVDKVAGKELSDTNFTQTEKTKLSGIATGATKNATDAQLRARASHTGVQAISTITGLQDGLDSKVDKEEGKGLSTSDFTPAEKLKLASLESSRYKGLYTSEASMIAGVADPKAGDYADVDTGLGNDVVRYLYDSSDKVWVIQKSASDITPSQIKTMYEENPDTNAFTDSQKSKLSGVAASATKNDTDAQLRARASHTGVQPISSVTGLQAGLDSKVDKESGRDLSDKNYTLVEKDKLSGIASGATKNATDAQLRARASHTGVQAISTVTGLQEGLDSKVDKVVGKELSANDFTNVLKTKLDGLPSGVGGLIPLSAGGTGATSATTARTALQLGNASTHNYGTAVNTVMMGNDSRANNGQTAFSWGDHASAGYALDESLVRTIGEGLALVDGKLDIKFGTVAGTVVEGNDSRVNNGQAAFNRLNIGATAATARTALELGAGATRWPTFAEVTGKPTSYTPSSHTHPWAQVTGQPAQATRWPTFDEVTDKPATYAPSGHTHTWAQVTGQPATATRWPTFAEVTGKPATYAPSGHTHPVSQVTGLGTAATANVGVNAGELVIAGTPTAIAALDSRVISPSSLVSDFGKKAAFYFTSRGGLVSSTANTDYGDFLALDTYSDSSGGSINGLFFSKNSNAVELFRASKGATNWTSVGTLLHTGNMPNPWPVGACYTQYPATPDPATLFGGTWKLLFNTEGVFFRTEGGGASAFGGGIQGDDNKSHAHTASTNSTGAHTHTVSGTAASAGAHAHTLSGTAASAGAHTHTVEKSPSSNNTGGDFITPANKGGASVTTSSDGAHTHTISGTAASAGAHTHTVSGSAASAGAHAHTVTVAASGGSEARPLNRTIRVWQRTA